MTQPYAAPATHRRPRFVALRSNLGWLGWLAVALVVPGCGFNPSGSIQLDEYLPWNDQLAYATPTVQELNAVPSPNYLSVHHGRTCAVSFPTSKVRQELAIPKGHDRGTVILNGFRLRNVNTDHQVKAIATGIGAIKVADTKLTWEAAGTLADDAYDAEVEWCYSFTTVTWNSATLDAVVDDGDALHIFRDLPWYSGSVLQPMPGFLHKTGFAGAREVAVLLRGFIAVWEQQDNNLLQFAYHQDAGEIFVEAGKQYGNGEIPQPDPAAASVASGGFVTWESMGFLKDNNAALGQTFGELATALAGSDVGIINPPFNVTPRRPSGNFCGSIPGAQRDEARSVALVPYEFAIPVLSGWDLTYVCEDEHVQTIGSWIPKWSWTPGPQGGTLEYTVSSILEDKDSTPDFASRSQIKILGFRPIVPRFSAGATGGP